MAAQRLRDLVPFFLRLRTLLVKAFVFLSVLFCTLWLSAGLYGSFYYAYMPQQTYLLPVHLSFDSCPPTESGFSDRCSFPKAHVSFDLKHRHHTGGHHYLMAGQTYSISLELDVPVDEKNRNTGMFMSCLTLETSDNKEAGHRCRSGILPYRPEVWRTLWSFFGLLWPEQNYAGQETIAVEFFEDFQDNVHAPVNSAQIEIRSRTLGVEKARMRVHAHFRGLRYIMYHHPVVSVVVGTLVITTFLFSVLLVACGKVCGAKNKRGIVAFVPTAEKPLSSLDRCASMGKISRKISTSSDRQDAFQEEEEDGDGLFMKPLAHQGSQLDHLHVE